MILNNLFQDKRGIIQRGFMWILLVLTLAVLFIAPNYVSAGKPDQYFNGNLTCENLTDNVLWSALSPKSNIQHEWFNWTPGTSCPGNKNCDMVILSVYTRYSNVGTSSTALPIGAGYTQVANTTESGPSANGSRHVGYMNVTLAQGDVLGPQYECGISSDTVDSNRTCNTAGQGFNESIFNYTIHVKAGIAAANRRLLVDDFEIKYPWCWTPIIYDATVSPESADNATTFTFTINNLSLYPSANLSNIGPAIRQGPHHGAQKSTTTGVLHFKTFSSN